MKQLTMKLPFYKDPNKLIRGVLLALFAGGLALLSLAASDLSSNKPLTQSDKAQAAIYKVAVPGALMAHSCAGCHGTLGRLGDESFMPLAGMPLRQFTTSMVDFREGKRPATLMGHVAQGFSDAEIRAMGEYFAAVKPEGNQP
jgi:cytochrome subunit of sulfide dehydrogenase